MYQFARVTAKQAKGAQEEWAAQQLCRKKEVKMIWKIGDKTAEKRVSKKEIACECTEKNLMKKK